MRRLLGTMASCRRLRRVVRAAQPWDQRNLASPTWPRLRLPSLTKSVGPNRRALQCPPPTLVTLSLSRLLVVLRTRPLKAIRGRRERTLSPEYRTVLEAKAATHQTRFVPRRDSPTRSMPLKTPPIRPVLFTSTSSSSNSSNSTSSRSMREPCTALGST